MSHFTVLVIGEDWEKQLAKFQENNMEDCPEEYLKFFEPEENYLEEYETGNSEGVLFKEKYETFDDFMKDWTGYSKDPKSGEYGYWENPNAQWDWYSVGGRWTGFFKLKSEAFESKEYNIGVSGVSGNLPKEGWADQTYKKNIDFEGMRKDAKIEAGEYYNKIARVCGGKIPKLEYIWEEVLKMKDMSIEEKRELYHKQKSVLEFRKAIKDVDMWADLADFQISREKYMQNAKDGAILTFAVLMNEEWYERGEMGWWAIVVNEKDNWKEEYSKLLGSINDNELLTVVDCHI